MKTKIIATIGPSSNNAKVLKEMVKAGVSIARINTKYSTDKEHEKTLNLIKKTCKSCKVMFDIKTLEKIPFLKTLKFDFLALSFCDSADQIKNVRKLLSKRIKIIAKIENQKGIDNIDEIIHESDGVMVARGDLGNSLSFEHVPWFQKYILKKCGEKNKMDIIATEMLLSMVNHKRPTRAEVSDVANAVFDRASAVMLSEETAIGKYPVLVIKTMKRIIEVNEKHLSLVK